MVQPPGLFVYIKDLQAAQPQRAHPPGLFHRIAGMQDVQFQGQEIAQMGNDRIQLALFYPRGQDQSTGAA